MSKANEFTLTQQGAPPEQVYRYLTAPTPEKLIELLDLAYSRGYTVVSHCETRKGFSAIVFDDSIEADYE